MCLVFDFRTEYKSSRYLKKKKVPYLTGEDDGSDPKRQTAAEGVKDGPRDVGWSRGAGLASFHSFCLCQRCRFKVEIQRLPLGATQSLLSVMGVAYRTHTHTSGLMMMGLLGRLVKT